MDGSTDRCPQCGAAIRPSARFCVTCGIKLPESTDKADPAAATGWAARQEHDPTTDSVVDATTAWAMPAAHSENPPSDHNDVVKTDEAATPTANNDAEQLPSSQPVQTPVTATSSASWQNWDASASPPE